MTARNTYKYIYIYIVPLEVGMTASLWDPFNRRTPHRSFSVKSFPPDSSHCTCRLNSCCVYCYCFAYTVRCAVHEVQAYRDRTRGQSGSSGAKLLALPINSGDVSGGGGWLHSPQPSKSFKKIENFHPTSPSYLLARRPKPMIYFRAPFYSDVSAGKICFTISSIRVDLWVWRAESTSFVQNHLIWLLMNP